MQKGGLTNTEAHKRLKGTFSKDKNQILFEEFGINYNNEKEVFKRGSIFIRVLLKKEAKKAKQEDSKDAQPEIILVHDDLIEKEQFYAKYDII